MSIETITLSSLVKWLYGIVGALFALLCSVFALIAKNFNERLKDHNDDIIELKLRESVTHNEVKKIVREEGKHITDHLVRIEAISQQTALNVNGLTTKLAVLEALEDERRQK